MNINDVKGAAEDLVATNATSPLEGVHVVGVHGAERIDGFGVVEKGEFAGVFVLDSSAKPAYSSRVVEALKKDIHELRHTISWTVSCAECSNQLAEDWEVIGGTFVCRECVEYGGED